MRFPLPRRVFTISSEYSPILPTAQGLQGIFTALVTARYPGAIVMAAEYDIQTDAYQVAVLHHTWPLTLSCLPETWESVMEEYQEPVPCAGE